MVVGVDHDFSYERLRAAARAVASGAAFFAVNLDASFPVGQGLIDPGCGALAEAIAVAGRARPVAIGKPELPLFQFAIERLNVNLTRRRWSETAYPPTSPGVAPPECSRFGSMPVERRIPQTTTPT